MNPDAIAGPASEDAVDVLAIERPHPNLLVYYGLGSLLLGPLFFVALVPLYFRYNTLRYRFDEEGVSMRWGILFRREIHLTYSRIQDIHLTSNLVERWLGLGKVQIQTASGSSKAEMTIEGRQDFDAIRDFLYSRMRGMQDEGAEGAGEAAAAGSAGASAAAEPGSPGAAADDLATVLLAVAGELREIRRALDEERS
jgi:putative membrane protein